MKSSVNRTWTVKLKSKKLVTVDAVIMGVYDSSYGADADGNRGMGVWLVEDAEFEVPEVADDGTPLTNQEMAEIEDLINSNINEDEFFDFEDSYGYDYDDYEADDLSDYLD
jgi:hypothetical protein